MDKPSKPPLPPSTPGQQTPSAPGRVALSKDGEVPVRLGRLDEFAKMPEIPPGATVTVRVVNRYSPPDETSSPAESDEN